MQPLTRLIDGAMFNSGQCCCGIERIYVTEKLFDAFVEKAVAIVSGYKLGNPLDQATTLGPMANIRFADLVRSQTADAISQGATAHIRCLGFRRRWRDLPCTADSHQRDPRHARHARGELRPRRRHHEGY